MRNGWPFLTAAAVVSAASPACQKQDWLASPAPINKVELHPIDHCEFVGGRGLRSLAARRQRKDNRNTDYRRRYS